MKFAVVLFPGSNCDHDAYHVLKHALGQDTVFAWHQDTDLKNIDTVIVPGGFSYGDYLRCGAIARFSPIMQSLVGHARSGKLVMGICNGFQILQEAGLLPGAMLPNAGLKFICRQVHLRAETSDSPFTRGLRRDRALKMPIAHHGGNFFAEPAQLAELERNGQVLFRYCNPQGEVTDASNPNGSMNNIAGITNREGNVMGMMPHPERASEAVLGSEDGRLIFESMLKWTGN